MVDFGECHFELRESFLKVQESVLYDYILAFLFALILYMQVAIIMH
jgi:hypothetical protein